MRKRIAAANWKMNLTSTEATALASKVTAFANDNVDRNKLVMLAVPYVYIGMVNEIIGSSEKISIAAQNCSVHLSGAYTGEVSVCMLQSMNVTYVLIGHSECRTYHHETDDILQTKVENALSYNLQPVFCCGEMLEQRKLSKHFNVIEEQLWNGLFNLDEESILKCVIAYEPVWAIGTGVTASPAQASEMHTYIRNLLIEKYGADIAAEISLLYGGSCNENNASELFSQHNIDGGLIGGASLKFDSFSKIISAL